MNDKDITIETKDSKWTCDICGEERERGWQYDTFPSKGPNMFKGHPERFCFKCYADGIMWAMKQAQGEK